VSLETDLGMMLVDEYWGDGGYNDKLSYVDADGVEMMLLSFRW
jgi:hypothetical protein